MQEKKKARPPSGTARHRGEVRPDRIQHALDLEAAVSTLESKLNAFAKTPSPIPSR